MNPDEKAPWQYKPDKPSDNKAPDLPSAPASASKSRSAGSSLPVSWTAAEYIDHQRGPSWYGLLVAGGLVLTAGSYFLTKDRFAVGTIVVAVIILAVFAARTPQQVKYELTSSGLQRNGKLYPYSQFKSFAIVREESVTSFILQPMKRFALPVSAYFAAPDEERITKTLGQYLPLETHKLALIDRASHRLRL